MRSVAVVLPASMWAMIPMFRVFSSGYSRATTYLLLRRRADRPRRVTLGMQKTPSGPQPLSLRGAFVLPEGVPGCGEETETRYLCDEGHSLGAFLQRFLAYQR